MPPSTTMADPRRGADQPAPPQPGDDQQQGLHPMTVAAANVALASPTFDLYARLTHDYSTLPPLSQLQSPSQTLPSTTSHSNNAENVPYSLTCGSNTTPTVVSSNEARVSLPSREGSGGEPKSRPVTGAHEECVISVPISATGNAVCYSSEDMDRTVLEDVQVKTSPSNDISIK
jgi:hypothetical protein